MVIIAFSAGAFFVASKQNPDASLESELAAERSATAELESELAEDRSATAELESELVAAEEQVTGSAERYTSLLDRLRTAEDLAVGLEQTVASLEDEVAGLATDRDKAQDEAEELRLRFDDEIRAELQSARDAESDRACEEAKDQWSAPISSMIRWDDEWDAIGTRADLLAEVEACATSERSKTAEQREAERLAACELASPDEIEKDPDSYRNDCVRLYAYIVQFDTNTGKCAFRAEIARSYSTRWYDYSGNVFFSAQSTSSCPELDGIDNHDFVEVWATGTGHVNYDTQIGGTASAATFDIEKIVLKRKDT